MTLTTKGKVYLLILLANLTFSFLVIINGYFPYFGLTLSFIFFLSLAKYIKNDNSKTTNYFYLFSIFFSIMLTVRSEGFLSFLNLISVFVFGFLMIGSNEILESAISTASSPFLTILKSILTKSTYFLEFNKKNSSKNNSRVAEGVAAFAVTALVLAFIVPLLASVNPIFNQLIVNIINTFNIRVPDFNETLVIWSFRIITFLFLTLIIPKIATYLKSKDQDIFRAELPKLNLFIPKLATFVVILVFFATQIQLYFSSSNTLTLLGYTHSQYAREVFAQLTAVSAIILLLLYNDAAIQKINKILTYLLSSSAFFLVMMAFKSAFDYSSAWGFTYKRLYGFTLATWILGIFVIYIYNYLKQNKHGFIEKIILFTGFILIIVNLANFDYLIYNFKKSATGSGIDYRYLTKLSADSLSFKDQLMDFENRYGAAPSRVEILQANSEGVDLILHKIKLLQSVYGDLDIRSFNLMEYVEYLQIKNLDLTSLQKKYTAQYSTPTF